MISRRHLPLSSFCSLFSLDALERGRAHGQWGGSPGLDSRLARWRDKMDRDAYSHLTEEEGEIRMVRPLVIAAGKQQDWKGSSLPAYRWAN